MECVCFLPPNPVFSPRPSCSLLISTFPFYILLEPVYMEVNSSRWGTGRTVQPCGFTGLCGGAFLHFLPGCPNSAEAQGPASFPSALEKVERQARTLGATTQCSIPREAPRVTIAWAGVPVVALSCWLDENLDLQLYLCSSIRLTHSTWVRASTSHPSPPKSRPWIPPGRGLF